MLGAGPALGSVFGGLVVRAANDWRWVMWLNGIPSGVCMLMVIAFIPETNFHRPAEDNTKGMTFAEFAELRRTVSMTNRMALRLTSWRNRHVLDSNVCARGLLTSDRETSLWTFFIRPVLLLPLPAILWASVLYGLTLGWVTIQATANATAFSEVYGFSTIGVGNTNIAVRCPHQ